MPIREGIHTKKIVFLCGVNNFLRFFQVITPSYQSERPKNILGKCAMYRQFIEKTVKLFQFNA